jgi:imidazolonepropionase
LQEPFEGVVVVKLFRNARICTPRDCGRPAAGPYQGEIVRIEKGALLVENGIVSLLGCEADILNRTPARTVDLEIDCRALCLVPGFVDPHTHMCFAGHREAEFELRIGGTPYLEILKRGGGILSTVKAVAAAGETELFENTRTHALSALRMGTTTVEIKSGYGLDTESELKMLRVIDQIARRTPLDVVPTFLGAHAIPPAFREAPEDYVSLIVEEMLPAVRRQGIARYCDVFCEDGVFTVDWSRRILRTAQELGMGVKIHADEVHDLGGTGLAAELGAASADHLLAASDFNIARLAAAGVVAALLPATAYSLRKPYARAREMIAAGVPVALATDCNPGSCYTESMPFVIGLAVLNMGLSPAEALTAATLNAAYAIGMQKKVGSLDAGKQADLLLLDGESPSSLAYRAGVSPVAAVYKQGEQIF